MKSVLKFVSVSGKQKMSVAYAKRLVLALLAVGTFIDCSSGVASKYKVTIVDVTNWMADFLDTVDTPRIIELVVAARSAASALMMEIEVVT